MAAGCGDDGGGGSGQPCEGSDDCPAGEVCVGGTCRAGTLDGSTDGASPDGGSGDGATSDGSADADAATCPTRVVCGTPPVCCSAEQECIAGSCVATCESGVRCGPSLDVCCAAGQVCIAAQCADQGASCEESFDCPIGDFCEPTLGRCIPQLEPVACELRPPTPAFEAVEEWSWTGSSEAPAYDKVLSTPAIADLEGDGVPEVVFPAYDDGCSGDGVLVALRGDDGSERFVVSDSDYRVECSAHVAIGNIDEDPELEILAIARGNGGGVLAFEHDGTFKWRQNGGSLDGDLSHGAVSLANMTGDAVPEIIVGGVVLAANGDLLEDHGLFGSATRGPISTVADIDEDGQLDLVGGDRVLRLDGTPLWTDPASVDNGFPAVADLDGDTVPDIVNITGGEAHVLSGTDGSLIFGPVGIPGGGTGGPPTIADFDGDGRPEFSAAGRGRYAVYDFDCREGVMNDGCGSDRTDGILWDLVVQDTSSSTTGSSVFDFEEDGRAEVVYNDECFLRVLDGQTGDVLLERPNSSRTATENPIVVDVDGDGRSEIVVPANDDEIGRDGCESGQRGIRVFGDANNQWVRTRRVWNQHAYHVTNIEQDGTVPADETPNWSVPRLNNFRQNVQGEGVFNAADLKVLALEVSLDGCPSSGTLRARISNEGSLGAPAGVPVAFYMGEPSALGDLLGVGMTEVALLPGQSTVVELMVDLSGMPPFDFVAVVDDDGAGGSLIEECDEEDNATAIGDLDCSILI
jgi:hypothetical protein